MSWQEGIIEAARAELREAGAVIVRLTTKGSEVVSRVYAANDYEDTKQLRRVAVRRQTQLLNADSGGWNYYAVLRYADGSFVAWTGMHSILAESAA